MTRISRLKSPPKSLMLNENGSRPRHSIMKFWKTKDKETILRTLFFTRLTENRFLQKKKKPRRRVTQAAGAGKSNLEKKKRESLRRRQREFPEQKLCNSLKSNQSRLEQMKWLQGRFL